MYYMVGVNVHADTILINSKLSTNAGFSLVKYCVFGH